MTTTTAFAPDAAASLPGPPWLRARRRAAAEGAAALEAPTTEPEVWRYSRVDELDVDAYEPVAPRADAGVPAGAAAFADTIADPAGVVITSNGQVVAVDLAERWRKAGVVVTALSDDASRDEFRDLIGTTTTLDPAEARFLALNDGFTGAPIVIDVPGGVAIDRPIVVADWLDAEHGAVFPHLIVRLGEDAELTIVEHHGGDDVDALAVPVTELVVGASARLRYSNVQDRGPRTWQIAYQSSVVAQQGSLVAAQTALGGRYARMRADCRLAGRGATGELVAAYFGQGDQMLDFRTFQDHAAPDTRSNLLFKGVVADDSRSVYTGLIRVRPEGRGTNALQTNRTIKLGEHAWAESVPNLEIENNDVHCSHASAVGPIDEDQRFYLESRGVPPGAAERLIVTGFLREVVARVPVPEAAEGLWARAGEQLGARDAEVGG